MCQQKKALECQTSLQDDWPKGRTYRQQGIVDGHPLRFPQKGLEALMLP